MKPRALWLSSLVLSSVLMLQSCASIVNGGDQKIFITTTPPGAEITIVDTNVILHSTDDSSWSERQIRSIVGTSPMTAILQRGRHHSVQIKKNGYRIEHVLTGNGTSGAYWANLLMPGLWCANMVDVGSGAAYTIIPDSLGVPLTPGGGEARNVVFPNSTGGIWAAPILSIAFVASVAAVVFSNSHPFFTGFRN